MAATTPDLDLGKLLRVRAMVIGAAQMEATIQSARALVRAYLSLREDMILTLASESLTTLREEFLRLFPVMGVPQERLGVRLAEAAAEAQVNLRRLEGWIQGLIDAQTLEQQMRINAEEKARLEAKPRPGFAE